MSRLASCSPAFLCPDSLLHPEAKHEAACRTTPSVRLQSSSQCVPFQPPRASPFAAASSSIKYPSTRPDQTTAPVCGLRLIAQRTACRERRCSWTHAPTSRLPCRIVLPTDPPGHRGAPVKAATCLGDTRAQSGRCELQGMSQTGRRSVLIRRRGVQVWLGGVSKHAKWKIARRECLNLT